MFATSESVGEISKALASASSEISGAVKDAKNPHFKSDYATLASVIDAARDALKKNKLFVMQSPGAVTENTLHMTTRVIHESGEWIETLCEVPLGKRDPQGVGSAITYARRYALAAALNIPAVDDDGEAAVRGAKETISAEEAVALDERIKALGANRDALLEYYKVEGPHQLTPEQLKAAHRSLDKKEREAAQAPAEQ